MASSVSYSAFATCEYVVMGQRVIAIFNAVRGSTSTSAELVNVPLCSFIQRFCGDRFCLMIITVLLSAISAIYPHILPVSSAEELGIVGALLQALAAPA